MSPTLDQEIDAMMDRFTKDLRKIIAKHHPPSGGPQSKWFRSKTNHLSVEGIDHIRKRFAEGWSDPKIMAEMGITKKGCADRRKEWKKLGN